MSECKRIRPLLALRSADRSADEQRLVEAHLAACPTCAKLVHIYAQQDRLLRQARRTGLTASQRAQSLSQLSQKRRLFNIRTGLSAVTKVAATVAIILVIGLGVQVLVENTQPATPQPPTATATYTTTPIPIIPTSRPLITETPQQPTVPAPLPSPTITPTQTAVPAQPTPTSAPTLIPATSTNTPSSAVAQPTPEGENMLINRSFEPPWENELPHGWKDTCYHSSSHYTLADDPTGVHSGSSSLWSRCNLVYQNIYEVTIGTTYRFGAWGRIRSLSGRSLEELTNPPSAQLSVCISTHGSQANPDIPSLTICSSPIYAGTEWMYMSVDAVAQEDYIVVWLRAREQGGEEWAYTLWDDASLTVSPSAATLTPSPTPLPARSAPVPFDAAALYDAMVQARSDMEQIGGLIDRTEGKDPVPCEGLPTWYGNLVSSPRYTGVPADWSGIHADYTWAVERTLESNAPLYEICLTSQHESPGDLRGARLGIHESLERLNAALESAATLLGR